MKNPNPTERVLNDIGCVRTVIDPKDENHEDPLMMSLTRAKALMSVLVDSVFENAERDERGRQHVNEEQIELAYMLLEHICDAKAIAADMFDRSRLAKEAAA